MGNAKAALHIPLTKREKNFIDCCLSILLSPPCLSDGFKRLITYMYMHSYVCMYLLLGFFVS
jgi:hypothetical protein